MKKLFLLFLLFAVNSYAADFSPTPMTISVQPQLEYKFDGSPIEIPFTLTGKSGAIWLVINTHGKADNIVGVRNGHLGWHYVNKIDTTIYISDKFERQPGEKILVWDGKDENGNKAEPGTYDYYLWGYDDKSDGQLVCDFLRVGFGWYHQCTQLYEKDEQGLPLSKPMLMGNFLRSDFVSYKTDIYRQGTNFKWIIGSEPLDKNLIQTSFCSMYFPELKSTIKVNYNDGRIGYQLNPEYITYGPSAFDPHDYNIFYQPSYKILPYEQDDYRKYGSVFKWEFIPNGEAIIDSDWFGFDSYLWEFMDMNIMGNCLATENFIYVSDGYEDNSPHNRLKCIDYDGNLIFDKNFTEWYLPNYKGYVGQSSQSFKLATHQPNNILISSLWTCMFQMINTSRLFDDVDDETDMVIFTNSNGDYFMDNGWASNLQYPWFCAVEYFNFGASQEIYDNTTFKNSIDIDSNDFNLLFVQNYGIASFGVATQDGSGIGYMSFGDDSPDKCNIGGKVCDYGSAYDGIYFSKDEVKSWGTSGEKSQTLYMAFDSAHGMITNNPAVQEQTPLQFKVSQNTPNPFNPSTTISFSIPEKSNVIIDIYNITGQKIKTLINGPMSAGEHSVKWDAGRCSAGVYFYKVKAGKFEKTMRMTLVR